MNPSIPVRGPPSQGHKGHYFLLIRLSRSTHHACATACVRLPPSDPAQRTALTLAPLMTHTPSRSPKRRLTHCLSSPLSVLHHHDKATQRTRRCTECLTFALTPSTARHHLTTSPRPRCRCHRLHSPGCATARGRPRPSVPSSLTDLLKVRPCRLRARLTALSLIVISPLQTAYQLFER